MTVTQRFHIGWFQLHVSGFSLGGPRHQLQYVLVPEGATGAIEIFQVEEISDVGRPHGRITVNQLQLASPRDPDLTQGLPCVCHKETALIEHLRGRASAAGNLPLLPEIVGTTGPPAWARFSISRNLRTLLWRAGGAI